MPTKLRSGRRHFLSVGLLLAASGCFGKFGATVSLYDWNKEVSDNKWLRWLVFLVLVIVPVYELFALADAIVINTIEFFSGDNPIVGGHAWRETEDGHVVASSKTDDPDVIRHDVYKDGKLVRTVYVRREGDDEMWLLDADGEPVSRAVVLPDGRIQLLDREGRELTSVDADQQARIEEHLRAGGSPSGAVQRGIAAVAT